MKRLYFLLLFALLSTCSSQEQSYTSDTVEARYNKNNKQSLSLIYLNSQYEWALQYYHGKQYVNALAYFDSLLDKGAAVTHYERVPFYMGMCLFQLGRYAEAVVLLEKFLKNKSSGSRAQKARLIYVLSLKNLKRWEKLITVASESIELSYYPTDKILIQLTKAQALAETKEFVGAEQELDQALKTVKILPKASESLYDDGIDKVHLKDRHTYTKALLSNKKCEASGPPQANTMQERQVRYAAWVKQKGGCLVSVFLFLLPRFSEMNPRWVTESENLLLSAIDNYRELLDRLVGETKVKDHSEAKKIALEPMRTSLYRLAGVLEKQIKFNELRPLVKISQERLLQRVEAILHKFTNSPFQT